jgi:hypothetical protein
MKQFMNIVRTESPSIDFLFLQKAISANELAIERIFVPFLNAKKSKMECSSETTTVTANKIGFVSISNLLKSSV